MTPTIHSRIARLASLTVVVALLTTTAGAQKVGREYHEDKQHGYKLKYPKDWSVIPLLPELRARGVAARFEGEGIPVLVDNVSANWSPDLHVWVIDRIVSKTGEESTGLRARVKTEQRQTSIADMLPWLGLEDLDKDAPSVDETKKLKKLTAHHRVWDANFPSTLGKFPLKLDVWTFSLSDRNVSLVFQMTEERYKKWKKTFQSVAKTFAEIEREALATVDSAESYEDLLAVYEAEVARTPGWRVVPTPSQRFVIKTSADNDKFVDQVIERLEHSRDLFERDFPPETPIEEVSVVRVCGTEDEFHQYGQTGGGTAGWFNPSTKELVLFDASELDRRISFAVMTHEAFHQYCHFLFDESEAHRWFDEGHGDYYGAFEFRGRKAIAETRMPAGLDRLSVLRQMLREETWVPIGEHINFDHGQWQSRGVPSYAQSWSIVYMLRQGMLGEVPSKLWKDEYARIIPAYMETLHAGYKKAYAEQLAAAEKAAKASGAEFDPEAVPLHVERKDKNGIWKAAIEASWGEVDLDEFEENWLEFARKHIGS